MEDVTGFDACVMQQIFTAAQCLLPFLNQSANSLGNILHTCQTHEEANAAFRQFQLASHACKSPCTQFRTDLQYSLPQYLRARYVRAYSNVPAFYLYLPSTVKMATTSHSYVFISYIAEVAGWYNLFWVFFYPLAVSVCLHYIDNCQDRCEIEPAHSSFDSSLPGSGQWSPHLHPCRLHHHIVE